MVGTFKANNSFNTFLLFIYGLLLKLGWFIHSQIPVVNKTDGFVFREIIIKLAHVSLQVPFIYPAIAYLLIFTQAITFNKLINDRRMMLRANYLPAMSYLLITSLFSEWNVLTAPLVVSTLLILAWAKLSTLNNNKNPKTTLFNVGIMIGVSALFYFPSLVFVLLVAFAVTVLRPFNLAEWIISLLGILIPFYFLFSFLFLIDRLFSYKISQFKISYPMFHQNYWELAGIGLIIIAFLIGVYYLQTNSRKQIMQIKNSWNIILMYLLIAVFVPFISSTHSFTYWVLAAIPLSAYIACSFFYPVKRWLPLVLHWLMVIVVIIISYGLA